MGFRRLLELVSKPQLCKLQRLPSQWRHAIERGEEDVALQALRNYYQRVDRALMQTLSGVMKSRT